MNRHDIRSAQLLTLMALFGCTDDLLYRNQKPYVPKIEPQSEASKQEYLRLAQEKRERKRLKLLRKDK